MACLAPTLSGLRNKVVASGCDTVPARIPAPSARRSSPTSSRPHRSQRTASCSRLIAHLFYVIPSKQDVRLRTSAQSRDLQSRLLLKAFMALNAALHCPLRTFIFAPMTNGVIYCSRCGTQNPALAKFCSNCGTSFIPEAAAPASAEVPPSTSAPAQAPVYSTQPLPPVTPLGVPAPHYGGFWIRFVAFLIDAIVVGIVTLPVSAMIAVALGLAGGAVSMPDMGVHLVRGIVSFCFSAL